MPTLKDRVAIVTGAGSGIGEAVVRRFLAEGAKVVFTDLDAKKGEALAKVLGETHKSAVKFVAGDHTKEADNARAVSVAVESFGSLSILHNNAGVPQFGPLETLTEAELRKVLDANVVGPFLMSKAALPELRKTAKNGKDAPGRMGRVGQNGMRRHVPLTMGVRARFCKGKGDALEAVVLQEVLPVRVHILKHLVGIYRFVAIVDLEDPVRPGLGWDG